MSLSTSVFGDGTLTVSSSAHRIIPFGDDGTNGFKLVIDTNPIEKIIKSLKPGPNIQFDKGEAILGFIGALQV
jgi:hypothetical protein